MPPSGSGGQGGASPIQVLMALAQGQMPLPPGVTMEMVQMALQQAMAQQGQGGLPPEGQGGPPLEGQPPGPQGLPQGIGVPPQAIASGPMQPPPGTNPALFLGGGGNMPQIPGR